MRNQTNKGLIFVVSGPSGSGKTTLRDKLLKVEALKKRLAKSVSFTTRPKRSKERDGRDYLFITEKEFGGKLESKKILEWTKYLGYYYATSRDFVERQLKKGKNIILCLDLKGALTVKKLYPENTVRIFINPPSLTTLRQRIRRRCSKTTREEIKKRMRLARQELLASRKYDYCLVNTNLQGTVKELGEIISREIALK